MGSPKITERTITYGKNQYKTDGKNWSILMFGTYGLGCNGIPSYRFVSIHESSIPKDIKRLAQREM